MVLWRLPLIIGPTRTMSDFSAKLWGDEVMVVHQRPGHTFKFHVLDGESVQIRSAQVKANPRARRGADGYLYEAHHAACAALSQR